jgi:thioredoxin-dependent peroxiredoxin
MKAPVFSLPDQDGKLHSLSDYKDKWVIVYFYPKDDTPGCTKEACAFRDHGEDFFKRGVVVLGISKDTVASHKKFAQKYNLTFPLLSDPEHTTIEAFGAWGVKKFMGREFTGVLRNTYLIDTAGEIVKTYLGVNPLFHAKEILADIDTFQKTV